MSLQTVSKVYCDFSVVNDDGLFMVIPEDFDQQPFTVGQEIRVVDDHGGTYVGWVRETLPDFSWIEIPEKQDEIESEQPSKDLQNADYKTLMTAGQLLGVHYDRSCPDTFLRTLVRMVEVVQTSKEVLFVAEYQDGQMSLGRRLQLQAALQLLEEAQQSTT